MRKIAFVTTARSDYNTMYPVMRAAQADADIEPINLCAGMHLVERFGSTWRQLEADGIEIAEKVAFFGDDDTPEGLAHAMSRGVAAFTEALVRHQPDIVCVSGDRIENLPLFVAVTALGLPIAHMCGGDITEGAFDNQIRHTMTKLSHLHFVSMPEHARRVIQMGEEPWRVTLTGDAAIDVILETDFMSREELAAAECIPETGELCLSTYHPQTLGAEASETQYATLLDALLASPCTPVMIYPNIDPGHESLITMLEAFRARRPDAEIRKSFGRRSFYSLMHHCTFMAGNSSSGLWEAPSFALPAINVGDRQAGRVCGANVINVSGTDASEMTDAFAKAQDSGFRASLKGMKNPFGNGNASGLTLDALKTVSLDATLMTKKFHEIDFDPIALGVKGDV